MPKAPRSPKGQKKNSGLPISAKADAIARKALNLDAGETRVAIPPVVPQPLHEIALKEWRNHPDLQTRLRKILEDPVFLLASQTIIRAAFPGVEPQSKAEAGVSAEAMNAALASRYAHRSGMGHVFRLLKFLVSGPNVDVPQSPYGVLQEEPE